MTVKLLTEHHLEFLCLQVAAHARPSVEAHISSVQLINTVFLETLLFEASIYYHIVSHLKTHCLESSWN